MRYTTVTETWDATPEEFARLAHLVRQSRQQFGEARLGGSLGSYSSTERRRNNGNSSAGYREPTEEEMNEKRRADKIWLETSSDTMAVSYRNGREEREKYWAKRAEQEEYVRKLKEEARLRRILREEHQYWPMKKQSEPKPDADLSRLSAFEASYLVKVEEPIELEAVECDSEPPVVPLKLIAIEPKERPRTRLWIFPLILLLFFTKMAFIIGWLMLHMASDIVQAALWALF